MRLDIYREKSPLSSEDCFVVFDRQKTTFAFPVHIHPEFELNYVGGAAGAQRIIGDSVELIADQDLVLIANPELKHAWQNGERTFSNIHEITIQFHPTLLEQQLNKKQFKSIQEMFSHASRGIAFGPQTINRVLPLLRILTMEKDGFYSVMKLFIILHELSKEKDYKVLSKTDKSLLDNNDFLMDKLQNYILSNIQSQLTLQATAMMLNMSSSTFSRFIKSTTTMSFSEYVLDFRVSLACTKLKEEVAIAELVQECGFNSVSYFYRVFKKLKGMTPTAYRNMFNTRKKKIV